MQPIVMPPIHTNFLSPPDLGTLEESPSGGIPIPVHTPCFSVYELRHKLFSSFSSSAVYVYTYKNQIKSFRPPIHWVRVGQYKFQAFHSLSNNLTSQIM